MALWGSLRREPRGGGASTARRADIQGLRAIAVLTVMFSHAGVGAVAGGYVGVDVFFVISGFLITQQLLRQTVQNGAVPFGQFYAARARRILPMAVVVLLATAVASRALINYVRAREVLHDAIWASLFGANIHFANVGTDYFAQGQPPSPLQHYWSLSVEEQFYLVWPALLACFLLLRARRGLRGGGPVGPSGRHRALAGLALIVVASLAWSVFDTGRHPTGAYFSTFARAWELGFGALLAVGYSAGLPRGAAALRAALGWCGLAAIAIACATFDSATPFPGSAALLPVLGAAALIAAGAVPTRWGPDRLLSRQPLRYTGDISYSLYLWHWPVLIIAEQYEGHTLSTGARLLLLILAYTLSVASYHLYENPLHHFEALGRGRNGLVLWPVAIAVVLTFALFEINAVQSQITRSIAAPVPLAATVAGGSPAQQTSAAEARVARAVRAARNGRPIPAALSPAVADLAHDFYPLSQCVATQPSATQGPICRLGDPNGRRTLIVMGDSHAQQWMPALLAFAHSEHEALVPMIKLGCSVAGWRSGTGNQACAEWMRWAEAKVIEMHPDQLVLTSQYSAYAGDLDTVVLNSFRSVLERVGPRVHRIVVLGDPPPASQDPTDCLLRHGATLGSCLSPLPTKVAVLSEEVGATARSVGASYVPVLRWLCARSACPAVIGHTITFLDTSHITKEFATALAPALDAALRRDFR